MKKSGYVLAGFETLASIIDNFMKGKKGRFNNNFTHDEISTFFSTVMSGFLHSYGQDFGGRKSYTKYNKHQADLYLNCRKTGLFDNCTFIADSGGFQISIGRLTRKESDLLFHLYYEWLVEYNDVYDRAFILDVPPGPGCEIFHNFDDVYNFNLKSYQKAKNLPKHIREKIIYIHHFRTPKLWKIYTKILRDYDMFSSFKYHGTGGIVANMSSDMSIPCIIYVLPLIPMINECIKHKRNTLNFHILGGSNFRDILFYELFSILVLQEYGINLNITYDSSGIYKQVMNARFIYAKDLYGNYRKVNIKSNNLHMRFLNNQTVENITEEKLNEFANKWNLKKITLDGMYDPSRNTFWEDVKVYTMLYTLYLFSEIQTDMKDLAKRIYPLYKDNRLEEFYSECLEATKILNQGKLTKKQKIKAYSIPRSLDMLKSLDEDYCQYIVNKCLAKDEFTNLSKNERFLTI